MSSFGLVIGTLIVMLSMKPTFLRGRQTVREAKRGIVELRRRQQALSQKVRSLARESLGQRLTAGQDDVESDMLNQRIGDLQRRVQELEAEDRRILVMDERRGLSETGWILCIRRLPEASSPLEPSNVTKLWDEGRYIFCFASDMPRARRKALLRFPEENGFLIIDVKQHQGDLSDPPAIDQAAAAQTAAKARA